MFGETRLEVLTCSPLLNPRKRRQTDIKTREEIKLIKVDNFKLWDNVLTDVTGYPSVCTASSVPLKGYFSP